VTLHRFGPFALDESAYELRRGEEAIPLEPKSFDLLVHLVRRRGRVATKAELLDVLWGGEHVTEAVLSTQVAKLRGALGDDPRRPRILQTVHGRGYRFIAAVETAEAGDATGERPEERLPEGGDPAAAAPPPHPRRAFVGRKAVLAALGEALEGALAGRTELRLLVGEPGIGKTRTAEELLGQGEAAGARVLAGRCYEGEGAPAFWPWVQILRAYAGAVQRDALRAHLGAAAGDLVQLAPELGEVLGVAPPAAPPAGAEARFRLFDGTARFLAAAADAQPLVLWIDDLHWADRPSLLLLAHVARELREARLLVVATYRDVEVTHGHPLAEVLGMLAREPRCERVALRGLGRDEVGELVHAVTGSAPDADLADAIHELTRGNPFFVGEIARLLAEEGGLDAAARRGRGAEALLLPQSVREAIGRRLAVLAPPCQELLRIAAVIGRDFPRAALERLTSTTGSPGSDAESVLELLEEAVAAQVLVPPGAEAPGRYAFVHALVRQTLYQELPTPRRVRLHRQVGEVLETLYADDPERLSELAHHFYQASAGGEADRAVHYARRAAEVAAARFAWEEAAERYAQALQVVDAELPVDPRARAELLVALAEQRWHAGDPEGALAAYEDAFDAARRGGHAEAFARAALGIEDMEILDPATMERVRALLEEALERLGEGHPALRARLLSRLGSEIFAPSLEVRATRGAQAVALARRAGDPVALFEALDARATALLAPEALPERAAVHDEMLAVALAAAGDPQLELAARSERVRDLVAFGRMPEADAELARCDEIAALLRQPRWAWSNLRFHVMRAIGDGRFAEAHRQIEEAARLATVLGEKAAEPSYWAQRGFLYEAQGRVHELFGDVESVIERFRWLMPALVRGVHGFLLVRADRLEEARTQLAPFLDTGFAEVPRDESWLLIVAGAVDVVAALRLPDAAASLHALLAPFAGWTVSHQLLRIYLGPVSHYLGLAAAVAGWREPAHRHFEAALVEGERMGTRPRLARTHLELGRLLAGEAPGVGADLFSDKPAAPAPDTSAVRGAGGAAPRPAPVDPDRAQAHLEAAARLAEDLGIRGIPGEARLILGDL